jgi:DNA-binding NtrC family response regulator
LADALVDAANDRTRVLSLWGVEGAGLRTATNDLARSARLQGLVPLALPLIERTAATLHDLLAGRSVVLIDRSGGACWSRLIEWGRRSPRSHVLLISGRQEVARVDGLGLTRLSMEALLGCVHPPVGTEEPRILDAARSARGLPGRLVERLWGKSAARTAWAGSRVAEHAPEYGAGGACRVDSGNRGPLWVAPVELERWRGSSERAVALLRAGRGAAGERAMRGAVGALLRRGDWLPAFRGLLALAASHLARGRPVDARAILREVDACSDRVKEAEGFEPQRQWALLEAAVLVDLGQLQEGAHVLTTALTAARGVGDSEACWSIRVSLSRVRFWLGQYEDAWRVLEDDRPLGAAGGATSARLEATRLDVRRLAARSRVEAGRGRHGKAIADAAAAVRVADRLDDPGAVAQAAQASAFAYLAVGDLAAVDREVSRAVTAARAAHDPFRVLKAKLLGAESTRRGGSTGAPSPWVRRASRLATERLPITVRSRIVLLADQSGLPADEMVRRQIAATGLRALTLFSGSRPSAGDDEALPVGAGKSERSGAGLMEDVLDLLRCCQGAEGSEEALARVLTLMRDRLRASGVGCYLAEDARAVLVAVDGRRPTGETAARVLAAQQLIAPHAIGGGLEGGSSVRFDGQTVGAFVARWSLGAQIDAPRANALLVAAATAAAPAVAAAVHRRRVPIAPAAEDLLGVSEAMRDVRRAIESAAAAPYAVLVEGESGSGKELVARAVHRRSPRKDRPFCALNCAALPDELLEAELFGHARGAFSGAVTDRVGVFESADGGTLFLDEIGELSPRAQAKLLRTLQEGEVRRVGENVSRQIDVRVVAATNRDLRHESSSGRFRPDLLYRLDVVRITIAPLRARREDIPVLVEHFWREAAARVGTHASLSASTLGALSQYDWPGNVRELQNVLASLAVRGPRRGVVLASALPPSMGVRTCEDTWRLNPARRAFEERFVRAALVRTGGRRARAAQELGVSRQGLSKLMTRLGIRDNQEP